MATLIDYALMSGGAYVSTRPAVNRFPVPLDWSTTEHFTSATGFEVISYVNKASTEVVISYAGTDGFISRDNLTNVPMALGAGSLMLFQAAEYYLSIKSKYPNATITFTGHSMGGGLASLMAVFFGETAYTFDQAPYRNSASAAWATAVRADLALKFPASAYPQVAQWLAPLDKFIASFDPLGLGWNDGLVAREAKVTNYSVQGEFLSALSVLRIGTESSLQHGDYFGPFDLHAQSLLAAFLLSNQTADTHKSFEDVTFKLTDLLPMIFDSKLYNYDTKNADNENFLERLIRHEVGNAPLADGGKVKADEMLTRFTADLWKLAQDGGLTMNDGSGLETTYSNWNNVSKALTAFAMQFYYENTDNAKNKDKHLFSTEGKTGSGLALTHCNN